MNPIVGQFIFGFLLFGVGIVLFSVVLYTHNWRRTTEDFPTLARDPKHWAGWICLLLGLFIMVAPILQFIL